MVTLAFQSTARVWYPLRVVVGNSEADKGMRMTDGRERVIIEGVRPEIDCGRFPIKRTLGEQVIVEADIFTDGHDALSCVLLYRWVGRHEPQSQVLPGGLSQGPERQTERQTERQRGPWLSARMEPLGNDRFRAGFTVEQLGEYRYTVVAWVDAFKTWARDLQKRVAAGQDVAVDLQIGAALVEDAVADTGERIAAGEAGALRGYADTLRAGGEAAVRLALSQELLLRMDAVQHHRFAAHYEKELSVVVERERARYGAWYELFPRSCSTQPGAHGTFRDLAERLPYVASMGFDVVYLPPIHPIGATFRKGRNNSVVAGPDDPGSPWAIGAAEGGHKAVHPALGTLADFRQLREVARQLDLELALDLAFQCAPDHPYVKEHPEWFRRRPDGTVQYAENPPKKYQDIYPFDFESDAWQELWQELLSVVLFWIGQGVRIFRVDNPHTKPFPFWEWLIGEIKRDYPETIFLSEAFTRPRMMYRLAKLGFTQSYTYFTWRNTQAELSRYLGELTQTEVREYLRPNLWPNTPDILPEYLQLGGRAAFAARLILAATLGASYGIYGPAFELCENVPIAAGKEEYLDSEKYEIRQRDPADLLHRPDGLRRLIARVNRIRRDNPALHSNDSLRFHLVTNDQMIAYSKATGDNLILVIVNLDPHHAHSGFVELSPDLFEALGGGAQHASGGGGAYQVHDLLSDARYLWSGPRNYVELNPAVVPAHVFRLRRRVRTERDFEYFL